jgi:hypothetical protein
MTPDNSINIKLPPIAPLFTILGWYWIFLKISWNYIKRPKIEMKFKPDYINVSDDDDKVMSNFSVPSIIVTPKNHELEIRIKSIRVGSSYYGYLSRGFSVLTGKKHSSKVLSSIEQNETEKKRAIHSNQQVSAFDNSFAIYWSSLRLLSI